MFKEIKNAKLKVVTHCQPSRVYLETQLVHVCAFPLQVKQGYSHLVQMLGVPETVFWLIVYVLMQVWQLLPEEQVAHPTGQLAHVLLAVFK